MDVIASKTYSLARLHTETECGQEWKSALYSFSPSTLRERKKFYDRLIKVNSARVVNNYTDWLSWSNGHDICLPNTRC